MKLRQRPKALKELRSPAGIELSPTESLLPLKKLFNKAVEKFVEKEPSSTINIPMLNSF